MCGRSAPDEAMDLSVLAHRLQLSNTASRPHPARDIGWDVASAVDSHLLADPVSVATAINTAAEVPENWKPENKRQPARPKPTHGKFGYNFSWHDTNTDMSVSVLHPGLQDLLQEDSDLFSLLEVRHHLPSRGTYLKNLSFLLSLIMYRPAPFVLHMARERNQRIYIS